MVGFFHPLRSLRSLSTSRRAWLGRSLALAGVAALALSSTSCASLVGEQDISVDFKVLPNPDGSFFGWTNISLSGDTSAANSATILAVTLDVEKPEGTPDMVFMKTLTGELVLDQTRQLAVVGDKFPRGEQSVALGIKYTGDIRPFFKNGTDLRVEWKGTTDTTFKGWPADGFWLRGRVKIDVE